MKKKLLNLITEDKHKKEMLADKEYDRFVSEKDEYTPVKTQVQRHILKGKVWFVDSLIEASKDLPVKEIPLHELRCIKNKLPMLHDPVTIVELAYHAKVANEANLDYPIILGENGRIMDGWHRIIKALVTGQDTIKAKQFESDPEPDEYKEDVKTSNEFYWRDLSNGVESYQGSEGLGYVCAKLSKKSSDIIKGWASEIGLNNVIDDLHTTIIYDSSNPTVDKLDTNKQVSYEAIVQNVEALGEGEWAAVTLVLDSNDLVNRHKVLKAMGYSHSYDNFIPHISLVYKYTEEEKQLIEDNLDMLKERLQYKLLFDYELAEPIED